MKNNQEKLTDAFGMLREDTLDVCVTGAAVPRRARSVTARRIAVLLAACLTFSAMAAFMLILPALRPEEPAPTLPVTDSTVTGDRVSEPSATEPQTETPPVLSTDTPEVTQLGSYDAPLVNVQMLALSTEDVPSLGDGTLALPENQDIAMVFDNSLLESQVYIHFDTEEGETVTATSQSGVIVSAQLTNQPSLYQFSTWEEKLAAHTAYGAGGIRYTSSHSHELVMEDPSETFLNWGRVRRSNRGFNPDEDFVDFVIRDAEGRIVGAGSIYLANRKLLNQTQNYYYHDVSITRGKVLGSVRFENPDEVTEEAVTDFLQELHEQADGIRDTLFENPTLFEQFTVALADVINTRYAEYDGFSTGYGYGSDNCYVVFSILGEVDSDFPHGKFLLMEDGTWGELDRREYFCEYCHACGLPPMDFETHSSCQHYAFLHQRFVLTDGRIYDTDYADGGIHLLLVDDSTYTAPTDTQVIESLMSLTGDGAPMIDSVVEAFEQLRLELGGSVTVCNARQTGSRSYGSEEMRWDRYATLSVRTEDGSVRDYLILEDGRYFEYDSIHYACEWCGYTCADHETFNKHEHGNELKVFTLTEGGAYSIRHGWMNGQAYAPEYHP